MPSARRRLGDFGEAAALAHLRRGGYTILARNWRCPLGELDLVARAGDQVVFVEVRTRRGAAVAPEESISPAKGRRLIALAYAYLEAAGLDAETPWRIDLIALEIDAAGRVARLSQIESAVEG